MGKFVCCARALSNARGSHFAELNARAPQKPEALRYEDTRVRREQLPLGRAQEDR